MFKLQEDDHVITIASAGCNVLDYIIEGARVTAVDFNACQIALTELKATAIKELNFDQFFSIFAKNNIALLRCVRTHGVMVEWRGACMSHPARPDSLFPSSD